jgi:hypothetical protein
MTKSDVGDLRDSMKSEKMHIQNADFETPVRES